MQEEHTTKALRLASVCPELHITKALDHLELALGLKNVLGLALRAPDYHTEALIESVAEVSDAVVELLKGASASLAKEAYALRKTAGGADAR